MEVEDSDVRKSRGRRSRNNSSNSKDSKSDTVREANGSEGKQSKVSNLPNGDEALDGIKKSKESSGNKGAEDKENHSKSKSNTSSSSESEVEKDCVSNSEATNGDVKVKTVSKQQPPSSDSEDEFKGFHGKIPEDPGVSAVNQLMVKLQSDDFISEDELDDDDREFILHYRAMMTGSSWTETNSPNKMDGLNDSLVTDDVCSSNASSPSVASGFSGDAKPRGKKSHIDVTNPAYLKPFSVGWKRELVFRNMLDTSQKRMADVYYYTPSGKKVRSARELGEHLVGSDLSEENFTFFKTPLGLNDPAKEIIRDAKRGSVRDSSGTPPHKVPKIAKTPKLDGTKVPLLTKDDVGSPKPIKNFSRGVFPRIRVTPSKGNQHISPNRPKVQGRPKKESLPEGELEMGMLPPSWKEPSAVSNARKTSPAAAAPGRLNSQPLMNAGSVAGKSPSASPFAGGHKKQARSADTNASSEQQQPCSIRCLSMMGVIPSLQCRLCLCLYHPECVGLGTLTDTIHSYVCKKCQQEIKDGSVVTSTSKLLDLKPTGAVPPPLTPISSLGPSAGGGTGSGNGGESTSPPKLQRLPRPSPTPVANGTASDAAGSSQPPPPPSVSQPEQSVPPAKLYTVPRYVKVSRTRDATAAIPKTIVGAVTTWLPASSTIQLGGAGVPSASITLEDGTEGGAGSGAATAAAAPAGSEDAPGPVSPCRSCVQAIARVAGKKYIVVPKHNVLSVSSAAPSAKVADPAPAGDVAVAGRPASAAVTLGSDACGDAVADDGRPPAAFVLGAAGQQSGLLLVPVAGPPHGVAAHDDAPGAHGSASGGMVCAADQPQYVIVNAQTGGVVFNPFGRTREDGFIGMPLPSDNHYMQFFMQNLSVGYTALHHVFQFLKVHELLRAARVCRMWHDLAGHPSLWKTVRMKNSQVLDWDGCAAMLSRHGTQHLDLRKMLFDPSKSQEVWNQFCSAIGRISSLRHLDLCRCPASVVERVSSQCPQLTNLIALFVHDQNLDLKPLMSMSNLEELRIKGQSGLKLKSPLDVLSKMTTLRHLSLTSVKDMGKSCPEALKSLTQLESLELGECSDFSEEFGTECLPRLTKLTRLRLEMGQGNCPTFTILTAGVHSIPSLTHLELVNFDIKAGFDEALAMCQNIRRLLIIPTYLTQSATTNHMVLSGVIKLTENLVQFVWGVTHELLHVTELFMDQCDQKGNAANAGNAAGAASTGNTANTANAANTPKGAAAGSTGSVPGPGNVLQQLPVGKKVTTGDSIPILRPVPGRDCLGAEEEIVLEEDESKPSPQVDILRLLQLQRLLTINLPKTTVTILKIPYSATWRQTLGEVNV